MVHANLVKLEVVTPVLAAIFTTQAHANDVQKCVPPALMEATVWAASKDIFTTKTIDVLHYSASTLV